MKYFIVLAIFLSSAFAQTIVGTLGVATNVTANTNVTINYTLGPSLVIIVSQNAQVILSSYATIQTALPYGFSALSFGVELGFSLQILPSDAVLISAELTTPPLTAGAAALITGSVSAGCLEFDASAQAYSQLYIDSYNVVTKQITVTLPESATYVFVAAQQNVPIPTFYNKARRLAANVRSQLYYTKGFLLDVTVQTATDITVFFYAQKPPQFNSPSGYLSVNAFFEIDLSNSSQVAATLNYTYNDTSVQAEGAAEAALEWGYYEEGNSTWNFAGQTIVDISANVVSKTVSHFSTWGVYARQSSTTGMNPPATTGDASGSASTTGQANQATSGGSGSSTLSETSSDANSLMSWVALCLILAML